jgi:tocopherol O-methyltransferase
MPYHIYALLQEKSAMHACIGDSEPRRIKVSAIAGNTVIFPNTPQTVAAVAAHYDDLDVFYRDIWGEHVHHGYWATGRQRDEAAADALVDLLAERMGFQPGEDVCDIGCGYGAAARRLAERCSVNVAGVTVSAAQARVAAERRPAGGQVSVVVQDWLSNQFADASFARAYAIESSEHMVDKQRFFGEVSRVLRPGGVLGVFVWLACDSPKAWEVRHLLEPICREGRLPSMGDEADYRQLAARAGLRTVSVEDLSTRVRRTWLICARRLLGKMLTQRRYLRFLFDASSSNRVFAITLLRILAAYHTGSMRYCLIIFECDKKGLLF